MGLETLPIGMKYGDRDISGYRFARFEAEWHERNDMWKEKTVTITAPPPYAKEAILTHAQLGLSHDWEPIGRELEVLQNGRWWEKWSKRWALRNAKWPDLIRLDEDVLQDTVAEYLPQIAASEPHDAKRIITVDDRVQYEAETPPTASI